VNLLTASLISFAAALPGAWAWVIWARAVQQGNKVTALLSDAVIVASSTVAPALAIGLSDWRVLVAGAAGNLIGTWIGMRRAHVTSLQNEEN
jgi:hypothetical protein